MPGVQSLARAYSDWNDAIDQYVRSTLDAISSSTLCPTRRGDHGEPLQSMNQRTASAPCRSISGIGSRMLPRCLLILRPSSARMCPRQSTVRYELRSKTSVPTAISE